MDFPLYFKNVISKWPEVCKILTMGVLEFLSFSTPGPGVWTLHNTWTGPGPNTTTTTGPTHGPNELKT